jgi:hypothetical protein
MNVHFPVRRSRWPGRLVQLAVIVVVAAVAAATFMLSYAGVHAVALQAGVPKELARYYPGILDAVLVIACAAAPVLRDAPWWARYYAWLAILVVVVIIGGIDAVHAMNVALPHRATAGVAAVLPWALLLLAFSLWLTILRHLRAQHLARAPETADMPGAPVARKALEAAASPAPLVADGDGAAPEVPGTAEASQAPGTSREAEAGEEPAAAGGDPAAATGGPEALPASAQAGQPAETRGLDGTGEPATSAVPRMEALPDLDAGGEGEQDRDGPDRDGPDRDGPDIEAGPPAEPGPESDDAPEAATGVPAITFATGPRLRRVRSLPAPPVDDE